MTRSDYGKDTPALRQQTVLETIWTDLPDDVRKDVEKLWQDNEYGNDHYYFSWDSDYRDDEMDAEYSALTKYLSDHGVTNCLIHYWW